MLVLKHPLFVFQWSESVPNKEQNNNNSPGKTQETSQIIGLITGRAFGAGRF